MGCTEVVPAWQLLTASCSESPSDPAYGSLHLHQACELLLVLQQTSCAAVLPADDDWCAAMSAIQRVRKIQQQRALQQLRCQPKFTHTAYDDDTDCWFDARSHTMSESSVAFISDAERDEVARLAHELEQEDHHQQQLTVSPSRELEVITPSCVPNPPLLFAEKHWKYCQVDIKPFCFYWERDNVRSSPFPLPIDVQMGLNSLFQKTHQSIPGMWVSKTGCSV